MNVLYLASNSQGRQKLLKRCKIPYKVISHNSDESLVEGIGLTPEDYVLRIASEKMKSVKSSEMFILTADTLIFLEDKVLGKPKDIEDAKNMLRLMRDKDITVITGCVLEKRSSVVERREFIGKATCRYNVDEDLMDEYFKNVPEALYCCGAGTIEGFGDNFLESINGSYSAVIGIPIYELRKHLKELGFN